MLESRITQMPTKTQNAARTRTEHPVPMLDLARDYRALAADIEEALANVAASQQYIMGPEVQKFEEEAAAYLNVKHALGCASGTDALWLCLAAHDIGPGDEVVTSPFSFFATASSIVRAGAKPVFADVDPETLNLDPGSVDNRVKRSASGKVKALMPVHLYGQSADMDKLCALAQQWKAVVVEDAAQAFGATWRGKRAGGLGDSAAFSFYPTKNLSCMGDGGMVTTNDDKIAARVKRLRNHGSDRRYYHEEIGWNSRLDSMQAAVLRIKLRHLDEWNKKREERATAYNVLFKSSGLVGRRGAGGRAPVQILAVRKEAHHIYHQYVIRVEQRDQLRQFLAERKIGSEIYYPVPLHLQKCFGYLGYAEGDLPESERAAREVLALPIFPSLKSEEQASVVNAISEFYG
jgi:dTDP-4-amino-4,6-dideoxygalactose transaminase